MDEPATVTLSRPMMSLQRKEDSAEGEGGQIEYLSGKQLNALTEAVFTDGRRTTDDDDDRDDDENDRTPQGQGRPEGGAERTSIVEDFRYDDINHYYLTETPGKKCRCVQVMVAKNIPPTSVVNETWNSAYL